MDSSGSSRLVFVSIKNQKSKRKVAVPIPDGMEWQSFIDTVRFKLKLSGIGDMYLASTGEAVSSLDQLQDIDEVHVVESVGSSSVSLAINAPDSTVMNNSSPFVPTNGKVGVYEGDVGNRASTSLEDGELDSSEHYASKYVKKQSDVKRAMKRMMPGLFQPTDSLPVTKKDVMASNLSPIEQVKRRMKKRTRRSVFDPRTVIAVFSLFTGAAIMVFVYLRATHDLHNPLGISHHRVDKEFTRQAVV